jgi:hypothetical protein
MRQIYLGNTLINDAFLGSDRMSDVLQEATLQIDWLLVGGGGSGGGTNGNNAGGGGAGRFVTSSIIIPSPVSIPIVVGLGGAQIAKSNAVAGNDGGVSTINILGITYTAPGGGGGGTAAAGSDATARRGRNGGSGGGAGRATLVATPISGGTAVAGTPIAGFGNNGENIDVSVTRAGNGGGASGSAGRSWLDGVVYSVGGPGGASTFGGSNNPGSGGSGATCCEATVGFAGKDGIVKIRYAGPPRATGGTITQSGGFTFHTFTTNGTFTY